MIKKTLNTSLVKMFSPKFVLFVCALVKTVVFQFKSRNVPSRLFVPFCETFSSTHIKEMN